MFFGFILTVDFGLVVEVVDDFGEGCCYVRLSSDGLLFDVLDWCGEMLVLFYLIIMLDDLECY